MAVENKYVNSKMSAGKGVPAAFSQGGAQVRVLTVPVSIAAADDDGSIYRLFSLASNSVVAAVSIVNSAITNGTDYDLGFYRALKGDTGAVLDKDLLMDGQSMATAALATPVNGLQSFPIADRGKPLFQALGFTEKNAPPMIDLALTANTVGTVAGDIFVTVTLVQA